MDIFSRESIQILNLSTLLRIDSILCKTFIAYITIFLAKKQEKQLQKINLFKSGLLLFDKAAKV